MFYKTFSGDFNLGYHFFSLHSIIFRITSSQDIILFTNSATWSLNVMPNEQAGLVDRIYTTTILSEGYY